MEPMAWHNILIRSSEFARFKSNNRKKTKIFSEIEVIHFRERKHGKTVFFAVHPTLQRETMWFLKQKNTIFPTVSQRTSKCFFLS